MTEKGVIAQVPVVHTGMLTLEEAHELVLTQPSQYGEERPEGVYLKVERDGIVQGRYKIVREEFTQSIIDDDRHWRSRPVEVQGLADGVNIFSL